MKSNKLKNTLIMAVITPLVVAVFFFTHAAISAQQNIQNCQEDGNQMQINACAAERFYRADSEMSVLYSKKISTLQDEGNKERLRNAQAAWSTFRDKTCLYESAQWQGGSGWEMVQKNCMAKLTEQRTKELQAYIACTQNGCPN